MSDKAYEGFERDVPEHLRDDAIQMMAEATGGYGGHPSVTIHERDRLNAINHHASGTIAIEGREFSFQMEDGDRNGTVLLAWNDDRPFERHEPTRWALAPERQLVEKALEAGRGGLLLAKWDAMLKQPELAALPGKYAYDSHFAPGVVTESHWRGEAARRGFAIVDEEEAAATRTRLSTPQTQDRPA